MSDNIIQIDVMRTERNKPRKCVCKERKYTIDTTNREITCGCGIVADPFEAMLDLANRYEWINTQHRQMHEQVQYWKKEKPYSVIFKGLERHYKKGTMLPSCPRCEQTFDFKDITSWTNSKFYRMLEKRKNGDPNG